MPVFDPSRTDLTEEFRRTPFGRHGDALQRVLTIMRSEPYAGHLVLVQETRSGPYRLARLGQQRGDPVTILEQTYPDREAAEWAIFRIRWRGLGGGEI